MSDPYVRIDGSSRTGIYICDLCNMCVEGDTSTCCCKNGWKSSWKKGHSELKACGAASKTWAFSSGGNIWRHKCTIIFFPYRTMRWPILLARTSYFGFKSTHSSRRPRCWSLMFGKQAAFGLIGPWTFRRCKIPLTSGPYGWRLRPSCIQSSA